MAKDVCPTNVGMTGPANLRTVAQCHDKLIGALKSAQSVKIDMAGISDVDLSFVQLIEAARRHAHAEGKSVSITAPADGELGDILKRGGFLNSPENRAFWLHETGAN